MLFPLFGAAGVQCIFSGSTQTSVVEAEPTLRFLKATALLLALHVKAANGDYDGILAGVVFVAYAFKAARHDASQRIEPGDINEERGFGGIGRKVNPFLSSNL